MWYTRKIESTARSAFTLVELLLVVTILGILAAVVVVNFTGKGDEARKQATRTSIANISTSTSTSKSASTSTSKSASTSTNTSTTPAQC